MKVKIMLYFVLISIIGCVSFVSYKNYMAQKPLKPSEKLLHKVTIMTSSYDGYSELWEPHYKLLFKNWPALQKELDFMPIMLVTNNLSYPDSRVTSLKIGDDTTWSQNLLKALDSVETKYVFLLFDDYIINSPVNQNRFVELLALLERDNGTYVESTIDNGQFIYGHEKYKIPVPGINGVIYRTKKSACRNSLQASIWNTEKLRKLINPKESAWDFEVKGSARTDNDSKYYMVTDTPVLSYLNAVAKRIYEQVAVDYINSEGIEFHPTKLPVKTRAEIDEYLKTKEAEDILNNYNK